MLQDPCSNGNHSLQEIERLPAPNERGEGIPPAPGADLVHQKCNNCGAQIIDLEVDGRISPGYYVKITFDTNLISSFFGNLRRTLDRRGRGWV